MVVCLQPSGRGDFQPTGSPLNPGRFSPGAIQVLTYVDASGARGKATAEPDIVEARFVDLVPDVRVVQTVDYRLEGRLFVGGVGG